LGPYIVDYPEQVWLAGIVQNCCEAIPDNLDDLKALPCCHHKREFLITNFDPGIIWDNYGFRADVIPFTHYFPRANIHILLMPDLLYQLIKGTFKGHLVMWVQEYLELKYGKAGKPNHTAMVSAVSTCPGLRLFPDGQDFSQWMGDDSKAFMKVCLAAIKSPVLDDMVECVHGFVECCYIARCNAITASDLNTFKQHLEQFHQLQNVFMLQYQCQHALMHYTSKIKQFASSNGVCSSIMESTHISAVKEPWQCRESILEYTRIISVFV
ncbi:hypothetical protein L208DRAFT_1250169, partial [Tricholoma matsutake]